MNGTVIKWVESLSFRRTLVRLMIHFEGKFQRLIISLDTIFRVAVKDKNGAIEGVPIFKRPSKKNNETKAGKVGLE